MEYSHYLKQAIEAGRIMRQELAKLTPEQRAEFEATGGYTVTQVEGEADLRGMLADPTPRLGFQIGLMVPYLAVLLQKCEGDPLLAETDHARAIVNSVGGVEYLRRFVEDPLGKGEK